MGFWEQAQGVTSKGTFLQFMSALLEDWKQRHELTAREDGARIQITGTPWKNSYCPDFLQAMRAWIADATDLPSGVSYQQLAAIMAAAAGYEPAEVKLARQQGEGLNCWEFKKCGREPGGKNVEELGVCPAAVWNEREGVNGGTCAGRMCWALVGTLCGGQVQGIFADKINGCAHCEFYQYVRQGEGDSFRYALPKQKVPS